MVFKGSACYYEPEISSDLFFFVLSNLYQKNKRPTFCDFVNSFKLVSTGVNNLL